MEPMDTEAAKNTTVSDIFHALSTSSDGLSSAEAGSRLKIFGPNTIAEKETHPLMKFLGYFWGPIPWMIEAAMVLSALISHWEDFWIILTLLMVNAIVGFWQEYKADNAIEALKKKLALVARVRRDGEWVRIPASDLVPGDVVRVRLGDSVPADIKLVETEGLSVDESSLTGESLPVDRNTSDVCYAGSIIRQGEALALVVSTGMNTYFGRTASLVEEAGTGEQHHFQKAIVKIGNSLIILAVALVVLIFIVEMYRGKDILDTLQFALVLTVAAIPVALPAVLSVTMAIGAVALAARDAIVRRLVAIEEMAGMDILCSDKTGTITQNRLTVAEVVPFDGHSSADVLLTGSLTSRSENMDPIDIAIIEKAMEAGAAKNLGDYSLVRFKAFDPVSKRTEAIVEDAGGRRITMAKGAPQKIVSLLENADEMGSKMDEIVEDLASGGHRALAVASLEDGGTWNIVGVLGLYDPAREDSRATLESARDLGVDVKMVTGDHTAIAKEIAREVGLGTKFVRAGDCTHVSDLRAARLIENADGFAEVYPEHKYHIVEILQKKGHIVGMTGDGVNDAPALKKADVGIAVEGATDAAKSAADIVLTKPGLSVIVDAIVQSRKIFQRMNNYATYRIAETIRVLLFMTLSILIFGFYPVTALMIVLLAILNDAPIMTIAFDNVRPSAEPDRWNIKKLILIALFLGLIGVVSSFVMLLIGRDGFHLGDAEIQSLIYLKLSVAGHFTVFVARTKKHFWEVAPSNHLFLAIVVTQIIATTIVITGFLLPALDWRIALFVWLYAFAFFAVTDLLKVRFIRFIENGHWRLSR